LCDTGEVLICRLPEDIPPGEPFRVLALNVTNEEQ